MIWKQIILFLLKIKNTLLQGEMNKQNISKQIIIPQKIQDEVAQRGFYFYQWIWNNDVKDSIQRDFLEFLSNYWLFWAVFLVVPTAIWYLTSGWFPYFLFFLLLGIINIFFLLYILSLWIRRSNMLRKNNQVLITHSSILINGNIETLENNSIQDTVSIGNISRLFEEDLFQDSNIIHSKNKLKQVVFDKFKDWYVSIIEKSKWWGRDSWKLILLLLGLYTLYAFSLGIIYFIWIIAISFLWVIMSWLNKKMLLITGHKISVINNSFENIDEYSQKLESEKNQLIVLLEEAKNNDWKDSLLIKINAGIVVINNQANKAVNQIIDLKILIEKSKYSQMFDFNIYNSWIKKQILVPLEEIKLLLQKNIDFFEKQISEIESQMTQNLDSSKSAALSISKTRALMRSDEIKLQIENIAKYIQKLQ